MRLQMALPCATLQAQRCSAPPRHVHRQRRPRLASLCRRTTRTPGRTDRRSPVAVRIITSTSAVLGLFLQLNCGCCCSPLVVPVVKGEVCHGYCRPYVVFSFLSSFCRTMFSINSRQLLSFAVILHSTPTLNVVIPSLFRSSSPTFPSSFLATGLFCEFFISHSFHMTSPFLSTPHTFLLK